MSMLSAVAYELGEITESYELASGFADIRMPRKPDMWGWGQYRRTERSLRDLRIASARRTLAATSAMHEEVDCLLICGGGRTHRPEDTKAIMTELGLANAYPVVLQSEGCESLLTAIVLADAMVERQAARRVLVTAAEKSAETDTRFRRYGIFSDAACSCLVSREADEGFAIVASSVTVDPDALVGEPSFDSDLAARTSAELARKADLPLSAIKKIFGNNVFLPISTLKEMEAGFQAEQLFTENIKRIGHCYACDALINLADYCKSGQIETGSHLMLAADAPGVRASILLRASGDVTAGRDLQVPAV